MFDDLPTILKDEAPIIKTIFVVDDDKDIGGAIYEAVRLERNYRVIYAEGCLQALELAEYCKPHLLLLDYRLPEMTGVELYQRLLSREGFEAIPVLFMTASLKAQQIEALGFSVLKKPFAIDELLQTIDMLLGEEPDTPKEPLKV
jgi:DNA-binding response OmpR family regulator